jgi:hypothetical protein
VTTPGVRAIAVTGAPGIVLPSATLLRKTGEPRPVVAEA